MPRWKVTFGFQQSTFSPTESYVSGDLTLAQLGPRLQVLIGLRSATLFDSCNWIGVRVGSADNDRSSKLYIPGTYTQAASGIDLFVPAKGGKPVAPPDSRPDQARGCLQINVGYGTGRNTQRYFSLVPDGILADEPQSLRFDLFPTWTLLFSNLVAELTSGRWFVRCRNRLSGFTPVPIVGWTQATSGPTYLGALLANGTVPAVTQGSKVSIRGVRLRTSDPTSYNGTYVVDTVVPGTGGAPTTVFLRGTEAGTATDIRTLGTLTLIGYDYLAINAFAPVRAATHKRGNSFARPLGRRKTRRSLAR